jgi:hypothetical protein
MTTDQLQLVRSRLDAVDTIDRELSPVMQRALKRIDRLQANGLK